MIQTIDLGLTDGPKDRHNDHYRARAERSLNWNEMWYFYQVNYVWGSYCKHTCGFFLNHPHMSYGLIVIIDTSILTYIDVSKTIIYIDTIINGIYIEWESDSFCSVSFVLISIIKTSIFIINIDKALTKSFHKVMPNNSS